MSDKQDDSDALPVLSRAAVVEPAVVEPAVAEPAASSSAVTMTFPNGLAAHQERDLLAWARLRRIAVVRS